MFSHPAVQAALAPFIVAVVIALLLRRMGGLAFGLAIIGGFLTTVMLTTGLALQPLTSTRKIILLSFLLPVLLPLIELVLGRMKGIAERWQAIITIGLPVMMLVIAINWVIWPVLSRQEMADSWPMAASVSLYVGLIGVAFLRLARLTSVEKSSAQMTSALALGVGTAVTTMIAASALYAQLAFSVVATVGSVLLIRLFTGSSAKTEKNTNNIGAFALFAAAVPLALIGAAATVFAQLSSWVLLCLVTIPLFAGWPRMHVERSWLRLFYTGMLALLPVIPAVWLAWSVAGEMGY